MGGSEEIQTKTLFVADKNSFNFLVGERKSFSRDLGGIIIVLQFIVK